MQMSRSFTWHVGNAQRLTVYVDFAVSICVEGLKDREHLPQLLALIPTPITQAADKFAECIGGVSLRR